MKLSIIIPAYNAGDTIGVQLEALTHQEYDEPWEVIVSDNGSKDDTLNVAQGFKERLPGLQLIDASDRQGAGHARNMGASVATGEFLLFCDADDEVAPGWLQAMGGALQQHDFIACRLEGEKLNDQKSICVRNCPQQNGLQESYPPFLPHAVTAGLGIRKSVHIAVDGFDEDFYKLQDTDYCWRVQLAGYQLHFVDDALIHMRLRETPSRRYRQAREWGEYNVKLYKKYLPRGMPKMSWKQGVRNWCHLLRRLPDLTVPDKRSRWLWEFNWALGRLRGCLKCRVLAP